VHVLEVACRSARLTLIRRHRWVYIRGLPRLVKEESEMRDITYEAYKATVVLLALLETLHTNCRAMAKFSRTNSVMMELARKFSAQHQQAENLHREASEIHFGEDEYNGHPQYPKTLLRMTRKMNREARVVARFFGVPTSELTASGLLGIE
jgi:hypothetical protein